ncbi:hypothetical protein Q8W71_14755 [Methylobacterium sp. NEAU 140]|uniref:hypothetical protein n=1 Tax=Methylobacterium sp. NEAU 140 TaxID=3064945 RepID=UPI002735A352|nr:hypothetical protein [Methylobacterium sp. NEAU 140]MDP4023889.1 hypothetical protein [Methylobacterium sp. NEAU 140]
MRTLLLACSLLLLPLPASALCRCACVRGVMTPICQPTDLVQPICQGLCSDEIRAEGVTRPLAGGQPQYDTVQPFDPAPREMKGRDPDYNLNPRGFQLGTAGVQSGNDAFSSSSGGGLGNSLSGGSGSSGR